MMLRVCNAIFWSIGLALKLTGNTLRAFSRQTGPILLSVD